MENENASEAKSYLMRTIIHGETNATSLTFGGFKDLFIQSCRAARNSGLDIGPFFRQLDQMDLPKP